MKRGLIYLDYAATTPVDDLVLEAMIPYFCDIFSNPSSKHACGRKAASAVEIARKTLADLMGARDPSSVVFTSGASESNNLAIKGYAENFEEPRHFVTTALEHKATLQAIEDLEEWGHTVSIVKPGRNGIVNPRDILDAVTKDTVMVSCMLVNNEIGTIQPVDDISDLCRERGIVFHCDATQGFGKMPVRVSGIDMMSISAHKFYGPKGVGALYVSPDIDVQCQISGGSQEMGKRSGTLNVPGIVGMSEAAKISCGRMASEWDRLTEISSMFKGFIDRSIPMSYVQGESSQKVPWIVNVCFAGADAGMIRDRLGEKEICVSRTSACAKSGAKSHVLEAIGTSEQISSGAVRFSFGSRTTKVKAQIAAKELAEAVALTRKNENEGHFYQ